MANFRRHTALVQGPLAYAMRRAAAARQGELGLQIFTPVQLAARLAGGLLQPASRVTIEDGIRAALAKPGLLEDIGPISDLPGTTRALRRTLLNVWRAGFDLRSGPHASQPRVQDLIRVEDSIRGCLQPGELLLPDLCHRASQHLSQADKFIGPLHIEGMHFIDPIWHLLINSLCSTLEVRWMMPPGCRADWFRGAIETQSITTAKSSGISCADPAHEALEAFRWARNLLANGRAHPHDIAIAATSTATSDDYMLALADSSGLPICFVHGRPAIASRDGQRCAALADVLQGGLSQARVRRLLRLARDQGTPLDQLPDQDLPIKASASLSTVADWQRALEPRPEYRSLLMPILDVLAKGVKGAEEVGKILLRGRSRRLWDEALRVAPASALMFTLETLLIAEERDPADAIVWTSADELAAAPRPFVWLLGVTAGTWPRRGGLDPILPQYILDPHLVDPDPIEAADLRCLEAILGSAEELVFSTGRLSADGKSVAASGVIPPMATVVVRHREMGGDHALTEADRLLSRPQDTVADPIAASAALAWHDWHDRKITSHDGFVGTPTSMLSALLPKPQSPTSLSWLLQDPLAYVWYYALGWRDLVHKERGLILPADDMGRLVHEILRGAVDHLEPDPGLAGAADYQKSEAVQRAAAKACDTWPEHTDVPPPVLWRHTVRQAAELALAGLAYKPNKEPGTRSWTEVAFGGAVREEEPTVPPPWDPMLPVVLPGTAIRIYGSIDRLDLRANLETIRVTDYKTGERPKEPEKIIFNYGAELQRVLYALACRTLLPQAEAPIIARLIYLRPPVKAYALGDPDATIKRVAGWVNLARSALEAGIVYPGLRERKNRRPFRLALPAAMTAYLERKSYAVREAAGPDLTAHWNNL